MLKFCAALLIVACDGRSGGLPGVHRPFEPSEDNFVWPPPVPEPQSAEDAGCRELPDRDACEADPGCTVSTRPSSCTWNGHCTEDIRYHYCFEREIFE